MRTLLEGQKNIIVADYIYHSALFAFKNNHSDLDLKIITRNELINKVSYSFKKDPIPFLIENGYGYKKAKKLIDILLTSDVNKEQSLKQLFDILLKKDYLIKDEYGLYELINSKVYLFELDNDLSICELLKRSGVAYDYLHFSDLNIQPTLSFITPNVIYFENKMSQYFYIFSLIRDRALIDVNQRNRIIVDGEEDLFYIKIMSELFNTPVCYIQERPLIGIKAVKDKINKIYASKSFAFTEEELNDEDVKFLKQNIEYYGLDKIGDFKYSYANLLEIVANKVSKETIGDRGVIISNYLVIDSKYCTYVTNFTSKKYYRIYSDDNVFPDITLKEIGYNTSYNRSSIDKTKCLNFLKFNNISVVSRVKKHLDETIFDSPFIQELTWRNIRFEDELPMPSLTRPAAMLYAAILRDRSNIRDITLFNTDYTSAFKGIECGDDFKKASWSVTNLETYINCPFKYFLNILIPLKKDDYTKRYNGTFIHKVFEKFNHADFSIDNAFKEGEVAFYKQFEKDGIEPTNEDKASLEVLKHWLSNFIKTYEKTRHGISFASPVENDYELKINFSLEDKDKSVYNFRGVIDKVIVSEYNGKKYYSILDYKTGAEDFNPFETFLGKSIQLPLYYYAIENSIQPDFYTKGASFGGFFIQHVFFNTIKSALKASGSSYLSEKTLINNSRYQGLSNMDSNYIASMDLSAIKDDGSVNKKGTTLLQIKHQFSDFDADEVIVDSKKVLLEKYNLSYLLEDSKHGALATIRCISKGKFDISPTSFSLDNFNEEQLVCNYCPYHAVCYHNKYRDPIDYSRAILQHFQKGDKLE